MIIVIKRSVRSDTDRHCSAEKKHKYDISDYSGHKRYPVKGNAFIRTYCKCGNTAYHDICKAVKPKQLCYGKSKNKSKELRYKDSYPAARISSCTLTRSHRKVALLSSAIHKSLIGYVNVIFYVFKDLCYSHNNIILKLSLTSSTLLCNQEVRLQA